MTSPISSIPTIISATSDRPTSAVQTPQASGDFLAMLMGALGQIAPAPISVTGLGNGSIFTPAVSGPGNGQPGQPIEVEMDGILNDSNNTGVWNSSLKGKFGLTFNANGLVDEADQSLKDFYAQDPITPIISSHVDAHSTMPEGSVGVQNNIMASGTALNNLANVQNISSEQDPVLIVLDDQMGLSPDRSAPLSISAIDDQIVSVLKDIKDRGLSAQGAAVKVTNHLFFQNDNTGYTPNLLAANDTYKPTLTAGDVTQDNVSSVITKQPDDFVGVNPELDLGFDFDIDNHFYNSTRSENSQLLTASGPASGHGTAGVASTAQTTVQAVILHLQSIAQNRDIRSFTIHLDPPELGKMQVKMSYGRDKSVRTDIMIEKSDTLKLMEQDSNSLKSALENTGLQVDQGSLNFSMADQGAFDRSDSDVFMGRTSASDENGIGAGDDIAGFEFKSSEEWSVDPSTGITRYNIVV